MSGWAERAALILADIERDPSPENVIAAQDAMEKLAEEAAASGDAAELEGVQESGHVLEMVADYVLDPAERHPGEVFAAADAPPNTPLINLDLGTPAWDVFAAEREADQ